MENVTVDSGSDVSLTSKSHSKVKAVKPSITVNNGSGVNFTPQTYPPSGGTVKKGDSVIFSAAGNSPIPFYAQSGLFSEGTGPFNAPKSGDSPLPLTVAATTAASYWLSLKEGGVDDSDCGGSNDGQINVGSGGPGDPEDD